MGISSSYHFKFPDMAVLGLYCDI